MASSSDAIQLLENLALDRIEFTGAGRGGPARWRCDGCWEQLRSPPIDLRKWKDFNDRDNPEIRKRARYEAFDLIEHRSNCDVAKAITVIRKAGKQP